MGTVVGSSGLVALLVWAAIEYSSVDLSVAVKTLIIAGLVAGLPVAVRRAKLWRRRLAQVYHRVRAPTIDRGVVYLSSSSVDDRKQMLDAVADALGQDERYDDIVAAEFPEGPGLEVTHTKFHNVFVRITSDARIGVVGERRMSAPTARHVESACGVELDTTTTNPFLQPRPVIGATRTALGIGVLVLFVVGAGSVVTAAYPSSTYNPAEKAVLVSYDVRADLQPGLSETDVTLYKARFLVDVVEEEAVEITWEANRSERVAVHGRQALAAATDARDLLSDVRTEGTPTQAAAADRVAKRLGRAEQSVADAVTAKLKTPGISNDAPDLVSIRSRLQRTQEEASRQDRTVDVMSGRSGSNIRSQASL